MSEQQPWEPGVIARFLTVARATVDLSHDMHLITDTQPNLTIARCGGTGCGATHTEKWADYAYRTNNGSSGADTEASKWAQAHAETCRALPRPAATQ
ncbi:hypothetical protein [Streptomyces sp. NPDC012510]|uniref:hypothetical protein n=1 Tax=Streptomyces sp. NPDC012510 TaxID=3364838 RepID=UPI0036F06F11